MKMLLCQTPEGRIKNIIFDPIPPEMPDFYTEQGIAHVIVESDLDGGEIISEFYVDGDGEVVERPEFDAPDEIAIVADGTVQATVALPDPCAIKVDGEAKTIPGGKIEIASDMPAEYLLELVQWPYIPKKVKVVANAPVV
jgi:hypothetical protein